MKNKNAVFFFPGKQNVSKTVKLKAKPDMVQGATYPSLCSCVKLVLIVILNY